jgi:hypothetical protein
MKIEKIKLSYKETKCKYLEATAGLNIVESGWRSLGFNGLFRTCKVVI